jgi:hypothetical protein
MPVHPSSHRVVGRRERGHGPTSSRGRKPSRRSRVPKRQKAPRSHRKRGPSRGSVGLRSSACRQFSRGLQPARNARWATRVLGSHTRRGARISRVLLSSGSAHAVFAAKAACRVSARQRHARLAAGHLRKLTIQQRVVGHPLHASEGKPSVGRAHVSVVCCRSRRAPLGLEKRRCPVSQKEGGACVAGDSANRHQRPARKRRQNGEERTSGVGQVSAAKLGDWSRGAPKHRGRDLIVDGRLFGS